MFYAICEGVNLNRWLNGASGELIQGKWYGSGSTAASAPFEEQWPRARTIRRPTMVTLAVLSVLLLTESLDRWLRPSM